MVKNLSTSRSTRSWNTERNTVTDQPPISQSTCVRNSTLQFSSGRVHGVGDVALDDVTTPYVDGVGSRIAGAFTPPRLHGHGVILGSVGVAGLKPIRISRCVVRTLYIHSIL